jgi:hypothetical protein
LATAATIVAVALLLSIADGAWRWTLLISAVALLLVSWVA